MSQKHQNSLIHEKSPYLLQHADNPVQWYPWSPEAFAKAKNENKPVFLSIGYSTCHWCHVMAHESFENEEIAQVLNEHFVSIKVDREERPDIDNIYMMVVTALTGSGGWPLSVFLTPEKKPFYGGTYFPSIARWGSPGFKELLLSIHQSWQANPAEIVASSQSITNALRQRTERSDKDEHELTPKILEEAYTELSQHFDHRFGGFGQAPKFPMGHSLSYLLRFWKRTQDAQALHIVEYTLQKMMRGGIYDHLGGGFHRYATDQEWQVPHFEKMLYDQAILVKAYVEGYQITRDTEYARLVRDVLDYALRDMQSPQGGFYSAEDADSLDAEHDEKKEGAFYVWSQQEIESALAGKDTDVFNYYFGIEKNGNAKFDPHGEFVGKNILYVAHSVQETAGRFKLTSGQVQAIITDAKQKLYQARLKRPRPHLDDKILTDWNGLMISGLALAARALDDEKYAQAARRSADFILQTMRTEKNRLLHRYRDGDAGIVGTLEDYAFFAQGLIDLYEATLDVRYLREAKRLAQEMLELFWDDKKGGLFFTAQDAEELLFRHKEIYDGAIPSGNSVAVSVLARLALMTSDTSFKDRAEAMVRSFASEIQERPSAYAQFLSGIDLVMGPSVEIVVAEGHDAQAAASLVQLINQRFLPHAVFLYRPHDQKLSQELFSVAPFTKVQAPLEGASAVYICQDHVCQRPVKTPEELAALLK